MKSEDSLKKLERRAYRSTFDDGIYDIQFAIMFLVFAWISVLESIGLSRFYGYPLLLVPLVIPFFMKRLITIPRLGSVEFGPKRKSRRLLAIVIGAIVFILTLPLMIMISMDKLPGGIGWMMVAAFAAPIFIIAVYSMDFPRLYIYAGLLIAAVVESEMLYRYIGKPLDAIISFGLPGMIILFIGIGFLVRFIKTHPEQKLEAGSAI